jgi:hypothetical protein
VLTSSSLICPRTSQLQTPCDPAQARRLRRPRWVGSRPTVLATHPLEIMGNIDVEPCRGRHRRRLLRTTIAERVPRSCRAPVGALRQREQQLSPFLALKGTDSITRGRSHDRLSKRFLTPSLPSEFDVAARVNEDRFRIGKEHC